jgi:hypothetical protein
MVRRIWRIFNKQDYWYTREKEFYKMDIAKRWINDLFGMEFRGAWTWINQYSVADMDGMAFSTGVHNIPLYFLSTAQWHGAKGAVPIEYP